LLCLATNFFHELRIGGHHCLALPPIHQLVAL
jgi:hypothetical protein